MQSIVSKLVKDTKLPKMIKIRQKFSKKKIETELIKKEVFDQLEKENIRSTIKEGMRIAITCGSRGITDIPLITKSIVEFVKKCGADPFVIPAMGSHGGATAEGQLEVLKKLGVVEEYIKCPIKSSMETKHIGYTQEKHKVLIDKYAAEADGIIVVGRIKAHTAFRGEYESGLMKMMTIGLGKQEGADICHEKGFKLMSHLVPLIAKIIIEKAPILFGVGIIENAYEETYKIIPLPKSEIEQKEPNLLIEAKSLMPKIFFESCDLLIIDKIGKNISGEGMDPNITGTFATPYAQGGIRSERVTVLDLTDETHGNALGIGMAHTTTRRLYEKMNLEKTYPNAITSTVLDIVKIPLIASNDKEAIQIALKSCTNADKFNARIIRIRDSMHLDEIMISEVMLQESIGNKNIEILGEPLQLPFDAKGNLW